MIDRQILIVDDDDCLRELIQACLEDLAGWDTLVAASGEECLQILQTERPNAILLDIGLPDINGIEVAKIIRAREIGTRQTPIIVVTAHTGSDIKEKCLEEGVNCVIHKPIDKEILTTILSRLLLVCA